MTRVLAHRVTRDTRREVEMIVADLSKHEDVGGVEKALKVNGTVKLLVNDPGVGSTALLLSAAADKK